MILLAYKVRASMLRLISEYGAVDSLLPFSGSLIDAVINEVSPDPNSVSVSGAEYPLLAGADKQDLFSSVRIVTSAVVPLIQREAVTVAVTGQPPH